MTNQLTGIRVIPIGRKEKEGDVCLWGSLLANLRIQLESWSPASWGQSLFNVFINLLNALSHAGWMKPNQRRHLWELLSLSTAVFAPHTWIRRISFKEPPPVFVIVVFTSLITTLTSTDGDQRQRRLGTSWLESRQRGGPTVCRTAGSASISPCVWACFSHAAF